MRSFHPAVARWFEQTLGAPTSAQQRGWEAIRQRRHTLIAAPTGSGKTLAAFLIALDDLLREGLAGGLSDDVRVVYVSPLKALSADIHKNLAEPRAAIRRIARDMGLESPRITAAVRTGDTPASERAAMLRTPPHLLVTTPESLYLLLTSERSRQTLRSVRTVIVDEIHAVIGTRRGAHLALTLERLAHVARNPIVRIGLSATQHPIDEVARYLVGTTKVGAPRAQPDCVIVDEGHRRRMDLALELPSSPLEAVMAHEVWQEYYDRLAQLIRQHKTTLVFVNTRRMVERVARHLGERLGDDAIAAHHGSLSKERRLHAEDRLKTGQLAALVATASLELGIDIGHVDLVCQIGSPNRISTFLQRVGRAGHTIAGTPKGRLFPVSRDDLVECAAILRAVDRGELDRLIAYDAPLDVLAQQIVAESACEDWAEDDLFELIRRAWPYRTLARKDYDAVVQMLAEGFTTRRGRRGALVHRDEVNRRMLGRRSARLTALTSGGAIPENADYRVLLDPDELFIGTLNEDFAIESMAGDVFQLGNSSWRILQVGRGIVRVADAKGAPPNIPFWLGEAPPRSAELSAGVSELRRELGERLEEADVAQWLVDRSGLSMAAAEQIVGYFRDAHRALGVLPTQDTLVLERFFDESGGMQLVLHAPFGSRITKAWGLALRKRFCRQFNFELQAAATEEGLLLSLGPQHSFPLADVFRYLHPATVRDVLIQAFLDAPVFQTRWRWNATISLAVPRSRGGKKVAPQLQRIQADDLLAAAFPDAAACLENIPGDREVPDHPLVQQTVRDCLEEAMDLVGLVGILERIHRGEIRCVSRDTPEPSVLSHEILTARPYAFLDDAPLEERRAQAVYARRASEPGADHYGALDAEAIARVKEEARPDPRDADELHDALLTTGFFTSDEATQADAANGWLDELARSGRAAHVTIPASGDIIWTAAERLPEILAVLPFARVEPAIAPPTGRLSRSWTLEEATVEIVRGRLALLGPVTAYELAAPLGLSDAVIVTALLALEGDGLVLRGSFTPDRVEEEWCDRRLLARIHRYTLNRLRAEIEPVTPADFMRFLFTWQHVDPAHHAAGVEGLRAVITQLDGFELAADAWERHVLPARLEDYSTSMLDTLSFSGEVGWGRLSLPTREPGNGGARPIRSTPVALFAIEHAQAWRVLAATNSDEPGSNRPIGANAQRIFELLRRRGASFGQALVAASGLAEDAVRRALAELVAGGLVTSDGFGGLRSMITRATGPRGRGARFRSRRTSMAFSAGGRWSIVGAEPGEQPALKRESAVELQARVLLQRYGVVFRRLLARESSAATWRELTNVYRRLEARGEIRGGRFVSGMSGEQFALPDAVSMLREVRRTSPSSALIPISAADPLNLAGIVTGTDRIAALSGTRIVYRDGVPLAAMEGDYLRQINDYDPALSASVASALAGRSVRPLTGGFVGRHEAPSP
jgi:ATP-dependent helicase Lhr and Lhr-like helicase